MTDDTSSDETRTVNVPFDAAEHERMRRIKDWHNLSWRDVIERGIESLDPPEMQQQ